MVFGTNEYTPAKRTRSGSLQSMPRMFNGAAALAGLARVLGSYTSGRKSLRGGGAGSQTSTKKRGTKSTEPTSQYHDQRVVYRRKSAPKRVKRVQRRKKRSFMHQLTNLKSAQVVQTMEKGFLSSLAGQSSIVAIPGLYSAYGDITSGWADIYKLSLGLNITTLPIATTGTVSSLYRQKICTKSGILDLCMHNLSSTDNIQLYIYECIPRRGPYNSAKPLDDMEIAPQRVSAFGLGSLAATNQGFTPYVSQRFCENYIILSCRKVDVQPEQSIDLQLRDSKIRVIDPMDVLPGTGGARHQSPWERFYLVQLFGQMEGTPPTANSIQYKAADVSWICTRTYNARVMDYSNPTAQGM